MKHAKCKTCVMLTRVKKSMVAVIMVLILGIFVKILDNAYLEKLRLINDLERTYSIATYALQESIEISANIKTGRVTDAQADFILTQNKKLWYKLEWIKARHGFLQ